MVYAFGVESAHNNCAIHGVMWSHMWTRENFNISLFLANAWLPFVIAYIYIRNVSYMAKRNCAWREFHWAWHGAVWIEHTKLFFSLQCMCRMSNSYQIDGDSLLMDTSGDMRITHFLHQRKGHTKRKKQHLLICRQSRASFRGMFNACAQLIRTNFHNCWIVIVPSKDQYMCC